MDGSASELRTVEIGSLGERLSSLRLCDASALETVRRSLQRHGQLTAVTLFRAGGQLEIVDGFKRVRASRALGINEVLGRIDDMDMVEAKLRLCALQEHRGLTEIEEGWLVRSLYREDRLSQPAIAQRMSRHKSWVWRRLMLVEALDPAVQAEVRLGLIAARAAVAVSRLPRGNQQAASAVVIRRGLTVRQTDLLVEETLLLDDSFARATLLAKRLDGPAPLKAPGPRPTRAVRNEADWMGADILRLREIAARLAARLTSTPLEVFEPSASELLHDALVHLLPVLRALDEVIGKAAHLEEVA